MQNNFSRHPQFSLREAGFLAALLIAPGLGVYSHWTKTGSGWPFGGLVAVSLVAYFLHSTDKKRARENSWRVSEAMLHGCELLGGWPGAFVAQRRLRHKVSKLSYQVVFWLIVAFHQFVAVDYMLEWKMTHSVRTFIETQARS